MYQSLNPDLPRDKMYNERSIVRHFLEFGQFELESRAYKMEVPDDFDWRNYLNLHEDLLSAGLDSEQQAIAHYLTYGLREGREY